MDNRSVYTPVTPQAITMSAVSARSTAISSNQFRMASDVPFFFKLGDSSVVATTSDNYSDGSLEYIARGVATHIAVILGSGSGTCYISELG